jgi:hypothetical protein
MLFTEDLLMAATAPQLGYSKQDTPESTIDALLASGDIEGARAEFERLCLESLDSGPAIEVTPKFWGEFRTNLHRRYNPRTSRDSQ